VIYLFVLLVIIFIVILGAIIFSSGFKEFNPDYTLSPEEKEENTKHLMNLINVAAFITTK